MNPTDRILIIPAAGAGVRFRELGKNYPKCILPVQGTPIIVTAIRELADNTGAFTKVVVAAGSDAHKAAIQEAIAPFDLKTRVDVVTISVPDWLVPSPAVSLNQILINEFSNLRQYTDFDVTVFLSDMLPKNSRVVGEVVDMPSDTWGVVKKAAGDYKRWCMVADTRPTITFYDKPEAQPGTNLAAVGVYRYSSAAMMIKAFAELTKEYGVFARYGSSNVTIQCKRELQFSEVAAKYQETNPLTVKTFSGVEFVDFGTLEEYLANKGINKCRSFNEVFENVNRQTVTKKSKLYDKIKDEAVWLMNAPEPLRRFLPSVKHADLMNGSIEMEQIRSTNLRDVALYLDRSYETWVEIFKKIDAYLDATDLTGLRPAFSDVPTNGEFWKKVWIKTESRLHEANRLADYQLGAKFYDGREWLCTEFAETLSNIMKYDNDETFGLSDPVVYMHGDLHFANMFYCFHYKDLKVIDPRGEVRGSMYYDIAKLCHSVFGRYDYIDAELYRIDAGVPVYYDTGHEKIESAFRDIIFDKLPAHVQVDMINLTASLFLSMIPLHADKPEHCELFYSEFVRLSKIAKTMKKTLDIGV